jgi:hypothetical protein
MGRLSVVGAEGRRLIEVMVSEWVRGVGFAALCGMREEDAIEHVLWLIDKGLVRIACTETEDGLEDIRLEPVGVVHAALQ